VTVHARLLLFQFVSTACLHPLTGLHAKLPLFPSFDYWQSAFILYCRRQTKALRLCFAKAPRFVMHCRCGAADGGRLSSAVAHKVLLTAKLPTRSWPIMALSNRVMAMGSNVESNQVLQVKIQAPDEVNWNARVVTFQMNLTVWHITACLVLLAAIVLGWRFVNDLRPVNLGSEHTKDETLVLDETLDEIDGVPIRSAGGQVPSVLYVCKSATKFHVQAECKAGMARAHKLPNGKVDLVRCTPCGHCCS
jgi:hypothetical protein